MSDSPFSAILPLTAMQEGLLFRWIAGRGAPDPYVVQLVLRIDGQLDQQRLRRAADTLLRRYPNLGAAFLHAGLSQPAQVIPRSVRLPWQFLDAAEVPASQQDTMISELCEAEHRAGFDLSRPPLMRVAL